MSSRVFSDRAGLDERPNLAKRFARPAQFAEQELGDLEHAIAARRALARIAKHPHRFERSVEIADRREQARKRFERIRAFRFDRKDAPVDLGGRSRIPEHRFLGLRPGDEGRNALRLGRVVGFVSEHEAPVVFSFGGRELAEERHERVGDSTDVGRRRRRE